MWHKIFFRVSVVMLILTLSLTGCASVANEPQLNPHPKHFLTIEGVVSPKLEGKTNMSFVQVYAGPNSKCLKTVNALAGIQEVPTQTVDYKPKFDNQGKYIVKIPLDKYLSGRCDWAPARLLFNLQGPNLQPYVDYVGLITFAKKNVRVKDDCFTRTVDIKCGNFPWTCDLSSMKEMKLIINNKGNNSCNKLIFNLDKRGT